MGHAVIINNVAKEFPASRKDASAMEKVLSNLGFEVHLHVNCHRQVHKITVD